MERVDLSPGEAVAFIFSYYNENASDKKIPADREILQKTFSAIRNDYPSVFYSIAFAEKGLFLESSRLDQALSNLESAGLVRRHNAKPKYYEIQPSMKEAFEKFVKPKFNKAGIGEDTLERITKDFIKALSNIQAQVNE